MMIQGNESDDGDEADESDERMTGMTLIMTTMGSCILAVL